jgi:hypothetical protein
MLYLDDNSERKVEITHALASEHRLRTSITHEKDFDTKIEQPESGANTHAKGN